ncbi:MAG: Dienelactone hydrolase family protein [uncultured Solirubrobacteraceae bacterium]|uniref:Dienelactone hydrolase family protein n=1 Tax=uncultured Solirubrobacteraceae bacterium TaxID=1162706 RepID=A0A6J4RYR0_9ACTN|nr:MAG: Dienelactone hydrolase family protein [uncultured Solirubrobacteraceae bacterium]
MQRYLAEEVAEDLADGIITRREALQRLGLMGVTGASASALLASFAAPAAAGGGGGQARRRGGESGSAEWAPVAAEEITFAGPAGTLMGAWAPAAQARGGVLVIHENRGLTAHIRQVAGRFAATGWSALALDLLSRRGGTGAFATEAEVGAALGELAATPENFDADMKAALTELARRVEGSTGLAAIGFCFGGGMVWRLLVSGEPRLTAAAPFYGPFPSGGDLSGSRAAVLGVYAGLDTRINASRPVAQAALEAAGLKHQILTFSEADHAFFNDSNPARYRAPAAAEAWRRVIAWFGEARGGDG